MTAQHPGQGLVYERKRRANTLKWLAGHGAVEGDDWRWGTVAEWNSPAVVDTGSTVEVEEHVHPKDASALPIMIRSSGVPKLGGPMTAQMMDSGKFPAEMPLVIGRIPKGSLS